jgi:hypothetical protein
MDSNRELFIMRGRYRLIRSDSIDNELVES